MGRYFAHRSEVLLLWRVNSGAQRSYLLATAGIFVQSLIMIFSSDSRTGSPAWRTINELGGPDIFGTCLLLIGFCLALAPLRGAQFVRVALLIASISQILVGVSFFRSALIDDRLSFLISTVIFTGALWLISHAELYRSARR